MSDDRTTAVAAYGRYDEYVRKITNRRDGYEVIAVVASMNFVGFFEQKAIELRRTEFLNLLQSWVVKDVSEPRVVRTVRCVAEQLGLADNDEVKKFLVGGSC